MSIETQIINRMRSIMLADAAFNDLMVIYQGVTVGDVPTGLYPYAEIAILTWTDLRRLTGLQEREYGGQIRFWQLHQDLPEVVNRAADLSSYLVIQTFIKATDALFSKVPNKTLNELTFTGTPAGRVSKFICSGGAYGIDDREERINLNDNFGVIDFVCTTMEEIG